MPEPKNDKNKINPQVADLEIGIRNLRTIKIYPLSLGDQLEMTDLITETIQEFFASREKMEDKEDAEFVQFFVKILRENLDKILSLITDEDILKELTNLQAVELADLIYEKNYSAYVSIEGAVTAVCEKYSYKLSDIYKKSFKDGGLTYGQIIILFERTEKRELERMKFQAMIHGIDLDKEKKEKLMFPHPDTFRDLPEEERKEKTEKQLAAYRDMLAKRMRF